MAKRASFFLFVGIDCDTPASTLSEMDYLGLAFRRCRNKITAMIRIANAFLVGLTSLLAAGCGKGGATVAGKTAIVMGPSTASRTALAANRACPTLNNNDNWVLTPNKARVTFTQITFIDDKGKSTQSTLTNCQVTYDRSLSSGSQLLQCPVQVPVGNIVSLTITIKNSFDLNLNDATNCIFSNGTAFVQSSPPGAQPIYNTVTVSSFSGDFDQQNDLSVPFTVVAGDTPTISVVADMVHTTLAKVVGGSLTFDPSLPAPPVVVFAAFGTTGKSEYYGKTSTADSTPVNVTGGEGGVRVFYSSTNVAAQVQGAFITNCVFGNYPTEAWSANAAKTPINKSNNFHTGGYLGLDAAGTLAWAYPIDFTYASYRSVITMPRKTTLGLATTATCQFLNGTAAPLPTSGDTYASGAPTLTGTTYTQGFTLLAN